MVDELTAASMTGSNATIQKHEQLNI